MRIATLLLPSDDNDGQSLKSLHKAVERRLIDRFGGVTASLVQGKWKDGDIIYEDASIRYEVWIADAKDDHDFMRNLAVFCLFHSQQKTIGLVLDGAPEIVCC